MTPTPTQHTQRRNATKTTTPRYVPGDILLVRDYTGGSDLLGNLILAGNRARYGNSDFSRWTHSALIVSTDGDLCEALAEGVRRTNITKYAKSEQIIITPSASPDKRAYAVAFALARAGDQYDILDFLTLVGTLLTGLDISLHSDQRFICSGLVARATECYTTSGYNYPAEQMMTGDLASHWNANTGTPLPPLSFIGRTLDKFRAVVWTLTPWKHGMRPQKGP